MNPNLLLVILALGSAAGAANAASTTSTSPADESAIRKIEEDFRKAKVKNDVNAIAAVVADEYYGMNQNGSPRDKAQLLELFKVFKLSALSVDVHRVRIAGDNAVVAGRQREVTRCADPKVCPPEVSLFLRTYIRQKGSWKILTSAQFRDPKAGASPVPSSPFPHDPF